MAKLLCFKLLVAPIKNRRFMKYIRLLMLCALLGFCASYFSLPSFDGYHTLASSDVPDCPPEDEPDDDDDDGA